MKNGKTWYSVAALATVAFFLSGAAQMEEQSAQSDFPLQEGSSIPVKEDPVKESELLGETQSSESYTIKPGDTLWDISSREFENPWYWPKLWSINPQISNPNWLFPGQEIKFKPAGEELPAQVSAPEQPEVSKGDVGGMGIEVPEEYADRVQVAGKIGNLGEAGIAYRRDSFVSTMEVEKAGEIYASHEEKVMLSYLDKAYIKFKDLSGVRIGDKFLVYEKPTKVTHPKTKKVVGYQVEVAGGLRIIRIDEKEKMATGEIFTSSQPVYRGFHVLPWGEGDNIRRVQVKPSTKAVSGIILHTAVDKRAIFGERNIVFIDKGKDDGLNEGNVLYVIRSEDGLGSPFLFGDKYNKMKGKLPYEDEAKIVVVEVRDKVSTGFVAVSLKELAEGDMVETRVQK